MRLDGSPLWRAFTRLASECSTKKTHADLPNVPEMVHVRWQCQYRACGLIRIDSGVCSRLEQGNEDSLQEDSPLPSPCTSAWTPNLDRRRSLEGGAPIVLHEGWLQAGTHCKKAKHDGCL